MKEKVLAILICVFLFSACGEESRDELPETAEPEVAQDSIPTLEGQFIYLADEAVFKGNNFIYGVVIDSTALDLAEKVKPYKKENFDMVSVVLRAKIRDNPGRIGYDEVIEIREVLELPDTIQKTSDE